MAEDRKQRYESIAAMVSLRAGLGLPPLKMVLLDSANAVQKEPPATDGVEAAQLELNAQDAKERTVRRIIEHLKKGM